MNDWDRIKASLEADKSRAPSTNIQIWRSTDQARAWLDANGIDIRTVTSGDVARFISEIPPASGPKIRTSARPSSTHS